MKGCLGARECLSTCLISPRSWGSAPPISQSTSQIKHQQYEEDFASTDVHLLGMLAITDIC